MSSNLARKLDAQRPASSVSHQQHQRRPPANGSRHSRVAARQIVLAVVLVVLVAGSVLGAGYYRAPMAVRVRHPMHEFLRPSGLIGQGAGLLAFSIFIFLWLYPLRKRYKALAWTGSVGRWLDVHVTAALTLPLLLAIHAAWRFEGLIGLGYVAILLVCASGIVGRYLYSHIPRARSGVELTRDEVTAQRTAIAERIAVTTGIDRATVDATLAPNVRPDGGAGVGAAMLQLLAGDIVRWARVRAIRRRWSAMTPAGRRPSKRSLDEAVRLASRELSLEQQVRLLDATHRVFRWWHVAHRPFALTALVAVIVHVIVAIAVGVTWLG